MIERPILMSAPMVLATLREEKSQTRRVVTTREPLGFIGAGGDTGPDWNDPNEWGWFFDGPDHHGYMVLARGKNECHDNGHVSIRCPYGDHGDRLWLRETWRTLTKFDDLAPRDVPVGSPICHEAGASASDAGWSGWGRIRQSIYCMRWMSRVTIELTDVRVERLQSITEADARAEGCTGYDPEPKSEGGTIYAMKGRSSAPSPRAQFMHLWDSLNGERAPWSANGWVWALTFKRVTP